MLQPVSRGSSTCFGFTSSELSCRPCFLQSVVSSHLRPSSRALGSNHFLCEGVTNGPFLDPVCGPGLCPVFIALIYSHSLLICYHLPCFGSKDFLKKHMFGPDVFLIFCCCCCFSAFALACFRWRRVAAVSVSTVFE